MSTDLSRRVMRLLNIYGYPYLPFGVLEAMLDREWFGRADRHSPQDDAEFADVCAEAIYDHSRKGGSPRDILGFLTISIRRANKRSVSLATVRQESGAGFQRILDRIIK